MRQAEATPEVEATWVRRRHCLAGRGGQRRTAAEARASGAEGGSASREGRSQGQGFWQSLAAP